MTTMIVDELGRIPMSPFLKVTLTRAAEYAAAQTHREVTLEHLLLSLAEDPEASVILKSSNVDISRLMSDVSGYLGRHEDRVDPESGPAASAISSELRKILEAAATAAQQSRRREINGAIVLAAIVGDGKSPAAHMLRAQGLTFEQAIQALQKVVSTPSGPAGPAGAPARSTADDKADASGPSPDASAKTESIAPSEELSKKAPAEELPAGRPPAQSPDVAQGQGAVAGRSGLADAAAPKSGPDTSLDEAVASIRRKKPGAAVGSGLSGSPVAESADPSAPNWQTVRPPPPADARRQADAPKPTAPDQAQTAQEVQALPQPTWAPAPSPPPQSAPRRASPPMAPPGSRGPLPVGASPSPAGGPPQPQGPAGGLTPAPAPGHPPPWTGGGPQMRVPQTDALDRLDVRRPRASANGQAVRGGRASVEAGQLQENLPRKMRVGIPVVAEALIARAEVKNLAERIQSGGAAYRHEIIITRAMTVRLRAPDGGFTIETASPETQWIENILDLPESDAARWRWVITARERGKKRLQLVVSARTVDHEGLAAETALPNKVIDVRVSINYARTAKLWAGWITAAVLGGVLARFGDQAYDAVRMLLARLTGG